MNENEDEMTPATTLAVIDTEGRRVGQRITFNPAWINGLWPAAWFFGFGAAYLAYGPDRVIPAWLGPIVASVLIGVSIVASIVYGARVGAASAARPVWSARCTAGAGRSASSA